MINSLRICPQDGAPCSNLECKPGCLYPPSDYSHATEIKRLREALEPFARSVFFDPATTVSGWRVGYLTTAEDAKRAHLAFYGKPTTLADVDAYDASGN